MISVEKPLIILALEAGEEQQAIMNYLAQTYFIVTATTGEECISLIEKHKNKLAAVVLDTALPNLSGLTLLKVYQQQELVKKVPFIIISSESSDDIKVNSMELGAFDYLVKPVGQKILLNRLESAILKYNRQQALFNALVEQIKQRDKRTSFLIYILSQVVKQKNNESGDHILHVRIIVKLILETLRVINPKYNLSDEEIASISIAACLHDIGKVKIDSEILNKAGKLTDEEFEKIKEHTIFGEALLDEYNEFKDDLMLRYAKEICRWHHEKWDGNGYPDRLKEDQIPIWAQAASIADCYDALTSERCYKPKYSHTTAVNMILCEECGKFNPEIIKAFVFASDKIQTKLSSLNSIELDAEQEAKRFANTIITNYKEYM